MQFQTLRPDISSTGKMLTISILPVLVIIAAFMSITFSLDKIHNAIAAKEEENLQSIARNADIGRLLFSLDRGHDQLLVLLKKPALLQEEINSSLNRLDLLITKTGEQKLFLSPSLDNSLLTAYQKNIMQHFSDYMSLSDETVKLGEISQNIFSSLDRMEEISGRIMLDLGLAGQDITGINQIYTLIPFCREQLMRSQFLLETSLRELNTQSILKENGLVEPQDGTVTAAISIMKQTLITLTSGSSKISEEAAAILLELDDYLTITQSMVGILYRIHGKHEELNLLNKTMQRALGEIDQQITAASYKMRNDTRDQLKKASTVLYLSFATILFISIISSLMVYFAGKKLSKTTREILLTNETLEATNERLEQEIAERRKNTEALRQYEHIVSASQEHMSFLDRNYIYRAVNNAYLLAHQKNKDEIIGHSVAEVLGQEIFDTVVRERLDRVLRGEQVRYENWFSFTGAGKRCMDVAYYPSFNKNNTIAGIVVNCRDITQRKLAEEEMRHAQKMESIGTMAGGIAHDFNNILTGILGFAELSMQEVPADSKIYENLEKIRAGGSRAAELVSQILAFSRHDRHEMKPLRLQTLIKETLKFLRGTLPATIEITEQIDPFCRPVLGDANQLYQIIMNLGSNAHHAMRKNGGILSFQLEEAVIDKESSTQNLPRGEYAKIIISDTGCGMDEAVLQRIFEPYFTTKEIGEGTGLGLASVHGIITNHKGAITVDSEVNKGTTFALFLPLYTARSPAEQMTATPDAERKFTGSILFIDDEKMIADAATENLRRFGFEVTAFQNSMKALEAFHAAPHQFDIVVTDQMMSGITGTKLAIEILQIRPEIPIILFTGYSEDINEQKAQQLGIREFIMKPLDMKSLAERIDKILNP